MCSLLLVNLSCSLASCLMSAKNEAHERAVWRLFRRLNNDTHYGYFRKSERPDFRNGAHGVELTSFIQDFYDDPGNGDHGWECRYQQFSKQCNSLWSQMYPGRPLPISVGYIPHLEIRNLKGSNAFKSATMRECAVEFVAFAASAEQSKMLTDLQVTAAGKQLGKYFQLIDVIPFKEKLTKLERWHYKRTPGWRYPQSGGGISVGSRVAEIVKRKTINVSKYPSRVDRLDLLLHADALTLASRLMPWAESELQSEPIDHGPFSTIWLLDVPGRKLLKATKL